MRPGTGRALRLCLCTAVLAVLAEPDGQEGGSAGEVEADVALAKAQYLDGDTNVLSLAAEVRPCCLS